jgi:hypothetical protein
MALKTLFRRKESVADDASEEVEKKHRPGVTNWILENVLVVVQSVVLFFSQLLFFFSAKKKRKTFREERDAEIARRESVSIVVSIVRGFRVRFERIGSGCENRSRRDVDDAERRSTVSSRRRETTR